MAIEKFDCGVTMPITPTVANAPLPAEGSSSRSFSNLRLMLLLVGIPLFSTYYIGGGMKTFVAFALLWAGPVLIGFWTLTSMTSTRLNERAKMPNRGVEYYLSFKNPADAKKYSGQNKIPMNTFHEMYFDGAVNFKFDALETMEWRHDWANFHFTVALFKFIIFSFIPEVIIHSRSQDEEQVRGHYDRGDDFYEWFLGPRMTYTSGIIGDITREETLEEMQDNKYRVVCEKIGLEKNEELLDIGCGWGTLAAYASSQYGARVTGVTLGRNQTKWGNKTLSDTGISQEQSRILCMDYRDIKSPAAGYDKITCLEMAEHVGVRHFNGFLTQVREMLNDDGIFFLQIAGLRKPWQFEDLTWGLFMNKYIFPGADASTPLGWYVDQLESAGFEIKSIDTIGVHYSATILRWYRNWLSNRENIEKKYGKRWFRIWEYFLAYSTIVARQGSAACYQIVMHKNLNAFSRVNGIPRQFGLNVPQDQSSRDNWVSSIEKVSH